MIREALLAVLTAISLLYNHSITYFWPTIDEVVAEAEQVVCGVCEEAVTEHDPNIIATACNDGFHIAHIDCMRVYLQEHHLDCPTCNVPLSSNNLEHVLLMVNDGDVIIPEDETPAVGPVELPECTLCIGDCDQQWPHTVTLHCSHGEHQFHVNCMHEAIHQHNLSSCPNCRTPIAQDDIAMINLAHQFVQNAEH